MLWIIRQALLCIGLAVTLSSPAGMASDFVSRYDDVPASQVYAEDISVATESGVLSGVGDGTFRPNRNVTGQELAIVLCRMNGVDATWMNCVAKAVQNGYYDDTSLAYISTAMPYEAARAALCRASGLDASYGDVRHEEIGITRAELAHFIVRVGSWEEFGIDVTPEEGYESVALETRDRMMLELPVEILDVMGKNGWSVDVGGTYIKDYMVRNADKGYTSVIGICSFGSKTIHVTTSSAILHESGHFWSRIMCQSRDDDVLFKAEGPAGKELLSTYSTTNPTEFMAEAFRYYVEGKNDEVAMNAMRKSMPRTYETFVRREANGWVPVI